MGGSKSTGMFNASSTSALPHLLEALRLPCFATGTPPAAKTIAAAVEILNVPLWSPPVPHTSIACTSVLTCSIRVRMASMKPCTSCALTPFLVSSVSALAICSWVAFSSNSSPRKSPAAIRSRCLPALIWSRYVASFIVLPLFSKSFAADVCPFRF